MALATQITIMVFSFGLAIYVVVQLRQIHTLVNSRLTEALREIKRLGGKSQDF